MINLMSDDRKSQIRAARANVILSRYIGIIAIAVAFLMGVLYVSYTVLQQTMATTEQRIALNDTKAGVYSATKEQVAALSAKLADAKSLLDQEVSYATVLTTLGQAMPQGTILQSVALDEATLSGSTPVELTAYAKTEEAAASIQQSLQGSSLFSVVSLVGTDTQAGIEEYPIKVTLTVTFMRGTF